MQIEIIKPFGPSIVKLKMPDEIIKELNIYTDEIAKDTNKSSELSHGNHLVGNVHQEILLHTDFMKKIKWAEFLANACQQWVAKERGKQLKKFEIIKSWIVRQFKNEYNPIHYHSGHISGVGYLKVPKNLGSTTQKDKKYNKNGELEFIDGSKKLFCKPIYSVTPEVGNFYLFPNYLMHTVYPFTDTDEERRSVSFNAKIDDAAAGIT
tara:strand:+ start:466 stop:1089 length:624 start_codon:yes stop_codon:yes gene_type:complete